MKGSQNCLYSLLECILIIETLISENIDEEMKSLVKLALESNEDHITMREMAEGIFNLFSWREENC